MNLNLLVRDKDERRAMHRDKITFVPSSLLYTSYNTMK